MAFPMLHSIIILSSPDSISIKAITPLPNRKEKRLAALETVTQSKEGRFIAGKTFLIYQIPQAGFMSRENTTKMVFRKRQLAAERSMA